MSRSPYAGCVLSIDQLARYHRDGFLAIAAAEPRRFAVVDASGTPDDVARAVTTAADGLVRSDEPNPLRSRTP